MPKTLARIATPYDFTDFSGYFHCNGCREGAYRAKGEYGPAVPRPFPHKSDCPVAAQESGLKLYAE